MKLTTSKQFSVHTYTNEAWGLFGTDACLSNDDFAQQYSDWVRNMPANNTLRGIVYVSIGTECHATISTDLLEPNTITVSFCYSPDIPESLE